MDGIALFRHLRRALRTWQLYPEESPARTEAVRLLASALAGEVEVRPEGLSFAFLEEGAWVEGEPIPPEVEGAGRSLGRRIFDVGVREFRFLPGVNEAELGRFCDPLSRALLGNLNPVDEDLSVLLWEADLPHVAYLLYEESEEDPPAGAPEQDFAGHPSFDDYVDQELRIGGGSPENWLVRLAEAERLQLLAAFRREEQSELPLKYGRLLLELLREELQNGESERLRGILQEFLDALAATGRFAVLLEIHSLLMRTEGGSAAAVSALSALLAWYRGRDFLDQVASVPPSAGEDREASLRMATSASADSFVAILARMLEPDSGIRPEIATLARQRLREETALQDLCLSDGRPALRRLALEEASPGTDGARRILEHLRDPDPALRLLVVRALGRAAGATGITGLFEALGDSDAQVRIAAAESLGRRGGARALEPLLRVLVSREFERREGEERRAFYLAAGRAAPEQFFPVLARMAERRGSWWNRHRHREQGQEALEALATLGDGAREFVSRRWARKRPDLLAGLRALERRARADAAETDEPAEERRVA